MKKSVIFGIMIGTTLIFSIIIICLGLLSNISILIPMIFISIGFVSGSILLFRESKNIRK